MHSKNMTQKAYDRFRSKIFSREIQPGSMVSLRQLTQLIDVPITPVRDAIRQLQNEGLVTVHPQRGIQVTEPDMTFVREAFHLREILEDAAIRAFVPLCRDSDLEGFRASIEDVLELVNQGDSQKRLDKASRVADEEFHDRILTALDNATIKQIYRANRDRMRLIQPQLGLPYGGRAKPAVEEHLSIVEALESRDVEAAASAMQSHLRASLMRHVRM